MSIIVDAVYKNGLLEPRQPLDLIEGAEVRVIVTPVSAPAERVDPLRAVIGIGEGVPDGSSHHDDYIYGRRNPS